MEFRNLGGIRHGIAGRFDGMVYVESGSNANTGNLSAFALNAGNNAGYRHKRTRPPSFASLQPNFRLTPSH